MKNYIFNNYEDIQSKSLKIIKLSIKAQEGECVLLDLLCVYENIEERLIELRFKGVSCFRGSMLGVPDYMEPGLMRVRYVAKGHPGERRDLMQVEILKQSRIKPGTEVRHDSKFRESLLKGVNLTKWELPYVDPVMHQLAFRSLDYQGQVLKDLTVLSMVFKKIRRPIQSLKVVVRAKWVHKADGLLDLVPYIKKAFPGKRIQTFTGVRFDALKGLSKIKTKTLEGGLKLSLDQEIHLPLYEITGEFWVQWKRSQPIQETVVINLRWNGRGYGIVQEEDPLAEVLEFEVRHVHSERESYFHKENEAVMQAVEQAVFKGYQSQQSEVLKVDVPFDPNLRLGDFVKVEEHFGRISRLSGNEMIMNVSITLIKNHGFVTDFRGVELKCVSEADLEKDLVKSVSVENGALEQREKLIGAQSIDELRGILGVNKTRISVEFSDLKEPVERVYGV